MSEAVGLAGLLEDAARWIDGDPDPATRAELAALVVAAADDAAARDRLAGQVDRMHIDTVVARGGTGQDAGRMGRKFRSEDDDPVSVDGIGQAPWVALRYDGSPAAVEEAARVLAAVDLAWLPPQGKPSGPDYRLHWTDRHAPGLTRVWPLPWPGRRDRGGRLTILGSFLLMLLLAATAILIAILIFSQSPPTPPPPPVPSSASSSGGGSGSPSESDTTSAEPSESPSPSEGPTPSESQSAPPGGGGNSQEPI